MRTLGFWALGALGAAILLWLAGWLAIGAGWAGPLGPDGRGMGPGMRPWMVGPGLGWGAMLPMMLSMLLFWVAAILGLAYLVRWLMGQTGSGRSAGVDALELARRRYARGEIGREEFERLRDDLIGTGSR